MKKICYIVTIPETIKAFFLPQLKYLSQNGFDVTIICSDANILQDELGESVRLFPIDIPRGISVGKSIFVIKQLKRFFKKEKFDLVQYSTPNAALYASIAAKLAKIKLRNYHLMGFRYLGANGVGQILLKAIEKVTCYNSTSIECVSKSNMDLGVEERIFPQDKATVIWNGSTGGVDLKRFDFNKRETWRRQIRTELNFGDEDFIYGFVGRITKDKGINELLEAFFRMKDNSKLLIIGDFEKKENLDCTLLEKAQKSERIVFQNFVKDIEKYYAALDVLVLPSYREGFGNVIIEAGAVGTPAIVSDIPGPVDAVNKEENGFTVEPKNVDSLYSAMCNARYNLNHDVGIKTFEFVKEKFDSEKLNEKILERKNDLIEGKNFRR